MKRRWRLWLTLFLFLLAGLCLLHPAVHWRLHGWARGEAFYDGRPTSWWVEDIEQHFSPMAMTHTDILAGQPAPPEVWHITDWMRPSPPPWWEWRPGWWGGDDTNQLLTQLGLSAAQAPLVNGDPDALPVLLELLHRPEVKSRQVAVTGLDRLARYQEPAALAALRAAINDPDPAVRRQARVCLEGIETPIPEPAPAP